MPLIYSRVQGGYDELLDDSEDDEDAGGDRRARAKKVRLSRQQLPSVHNSSLPRRPASPQVREVLDA